MKLRQCPTLHIICPDSRKPSSSCSPFLFSFQAQIWTGVGMESSSSSTSKMCKLAHPNLAWKGYKGKANNCLRAATQRTHKALQFSFRDRRNRKRDFRSLWNLRNNMFVFGDFMHGLFLEKIKLNRKVLSRLSIQESNTFKALVDISSNALSGNENTVPPP